MEARTIAKKVYNIETAILKAIKNVRGLKNPRYNVMCANIQDIYRGHTTIGRFVLTGTPLFCLTNGELRLRVGNLAWLNNVADNIDVQDCNFIPQQAKGIHINLLDNKKTIVSQINEAIEINIKVIEELRREFYSYRWLAKLCHCCWISYCDGKTREETKTDKQLTMVFTEQAMVHDSRVAELCRLFAHEPIATRNKRYRIVTLPTGALKNILPLIDAN